MTLRALCTRLLLPVVALGLCAASPASAAWPNNPLVNVPVCTVIDEQTLPSIVPDDAGGAIVTWQDHRSGTWDIYALRLSATGTVVWPTVSVALCSIVGDQQSPTTVPDGAGGAIAAWQDSRYGDHDLFAQRVSAAGTNLWTATGVPLCTALDYQQSPAILPDGTGGAFFAWQDYRGGTWDIYVQRLSAAGAALWTANGVLLCAATGSQTSPHIVPDGAGGAIVTWMDFRSLSNNDLYAQRISADGTPQWTANGVALCNASGEQTSPSIVSDGAGGAIVAWQDGRGSGGTDIYAQRVSAAGAVQWAANGVALCTATSSQESPTLVSDGGSGAIVAWQDFRIGGYQIYAQRISGAGAVQWTANGVALCTDTNGQQAPRIVTDGEGGALVTWQDSRGTTDVYAQRISSGGSIQWPANGLAISTAYRFQNAPVIASDGVGGAIITWQDGRDVDHLDMWEIYAQHVDRWGYLGPQPVITGVHDVPADDGGHVLVNWNCSPLDSLPVPPITSYYLWRQVPRRAAEAALADGARLLAEGVTAADCPRGLFRTSALGGATYYWEYMGSATATGAATYTASVATPGDSTGTGNPRTLFMVEAATSTAGQRWVSEPDSGYSVDNLPPAPPAAFRGAYANGTASLSWDASPAADLAGYRLHRGSTPEFVPAAGNLVATPNGTGYVDVAGAPYCYKLCAVDVHGNLSPYALLQPSGTVDVPGVATPHQLSLSAPAPNPLRGSSTMRLALPREAPVSLAVYDQQGRRVRTLLAGALPAGERAVAWDGRDDGGRGVANGIYFVRLECEGRSLTRRITALR